MSFSEQPYDLIVIGAGAAGIFCAINLAGMGAKKRVLVLEKTGKVLQKVKVSGGGRCNTTHHLFELSVLTKKYPRGEKFLKKSLHQFGPQDTIAWFAARGVRLKTEADGRMFPVTDHSQTIIDCLLDEADTHGVEIRLHCPVEGLHKTETGWEVQLAGGRKMQACMVCIATGGYPKPEQYQWITSSTGHQVVPPVPSLFTFNIPGHAINSLMGISTPVQVKIAGTKIQTEGPLLITHWGLSGPAVLKASAWGARELAAANYRFDVVINWLPPYHEQTLREKILVYRQEKALKKVINTPWITLPERLWSFLLAQSGIDNAQRWADLSGMLQNRLIKNLTAYTLTAQGKTTFKEEFVTAGGMMLSEIDPHTMQSRLHAGLYFAGEAMDIDGITGGFNFQHAWTSGMLAARHMATLLA